MAVSTKRQGSQQDHRAKRASLIALCLGLAGCAAQMTSSEAAAAGICRVHYETMAGDIAVTVQDGSAIGYSLYGPVEVLKVRGNKMLDKHGTTRAFFQADRVHIKGIMGDARSTPISRGSVKIEGGISQTYRYNHHCSAVDAAAGVAALFIMEVNR